MAQPKIPLVDVLCKDVRKLADTLNNESDVVVVLVGTSFLETTLGSLLQHHFAKSCVTERLLSPRGALGTFQGKMDTAYCLGLISKRRFQDLGVIAEIRNKFAHSHLELSFQQPEVFDLCQKLQYPDWKVVDKNGNEVAEEEKPGFLKLSQNPINRFKMTVIMFANEILMSTLSKATKTAEQTN